MMDENFLLHRRRALRLLELMEEHDKAWSLYVFSSANVLRSYTIEQLVGLGISWVWMGIEGENSRYTKLHGTDTLALVRSCNRTASACWARRSSVWRTTRRRTSTRSSPVRRPAQHRFPPVHALHADSRHAAARGAVGTRADEGRQRVRSGGHPRAAHPELPPSAHPDQQTAEFMVRAFDRDFQQNGPSTVRIVRTTLAGWQRYKNHPDPRFAAACLGGARIGHARSLRRWSAPRGNTSAPAGAVRQDV
jgi:hypothetical protein